MRVVTLTCSNTEIVCALGCADLLVGCDDHSDHPAAVVERLSRVGRDLDVDADRVAALRPDLVLASLSVPGHEKVIERLLVHKLNVLVLAPRSVSEVARDIRQVGGILGVGDRGAALAAELEAALAPPPDDGLPRPRILVEWWPKPCIAAGTRSWVQDLLVAAGADNALDDRAVESAPLERAEAAALAPDAVVVSWCGVPRSHYRTELVLKRPEWADVPAVRTGQVHPISEAYLGRPGPRLIEGLARLRAVVVAVRAGTPPVHGPSGAAKG